MNQKKHFQYPLKEQQLKIFNALQLFAKKTDEKVFILKGYAGTGKTTIIGGFIKWLIENEIQFSLLASTGRASKILSDKSETNASTVHSKIYTFNKIDEDIEQLESIQNSMSVDDKGQINLLFELNPIISKSQTIYIIDESSMISDVDKSNSSFAKFGSGKLLTDLLNYDNNAKFIFVGDPLQLPPINQKLSPALSSSYLHSMHNLSIQEFELTEIIRQDVNNGIIKASLNIRKLYFKNPSTKWANFPIKNFSNIQFYNSHVDLLNNYFDTIKALGIEEATLICQTNRHCNQLNKFTRASLGIKKSCLQKDDLLMVTQNNYLTNLVNGDLVKVKDIGERESRCGLSFLAIEIEELVSKEIYRVNLVENILDSNSTNLDNKQHKDIFIDYYNRMKINGITQKDKAFKDNMMTDPYLNALKAVYGYALTCHKSQGGEWNNIYLYLDNKIQGIPRPQIYQWFYTAITRAKTSLHIVDDWFIS
jgi:ATP-dependent exoDNAse (exonuclease V) alpha subunit